MNNLLEKYDKYDRFNKTILPNDWKSEAKKRPRNERNIWRCYVLQLIARTVLDVYFVYLQWTIYPYKYVIPELYVCGSIGNDKATYPCRHQIDCYVSRPYEKTVFFIYFYIVAGVCFLLNIFEFYYIGSRRLRHAFSGVNQDKLDKVEAARSKRLEDEHDEKAKEDLAQANNLFKQPGNPAILSAGLPNALLNQPPGVLAHNNSQNLRNRKQNSNKNLNNNLIINPPDYSLQPNIYIVPPVEPTSSQNNNNKSNTSKNQKPDKKPSPALPPKNKNQTQPSPKPTESNSYMKAIINQQQNNHQNQNEIESSKNSWMLPENAIPSPPNAPKITYKDNQNYYPGIENYWSGRRNHHKNNDRRTDKIWDSILPKFLKQKSDDNSSFLYQSFLNNQDDIEAQELATNARLNSIYAAALAPEPAPGAGVAGITELDEDPYLADKAKLTARRGSSPVLRACRRELSTFGGRSAGPHHRYSRRVKLFRNSTRMPRMNEFGQEGQDPDFELYDDGVI